MSTERPTLHVTNHSSKRHRGPGRRWTIMAAPRLFERADGPVEDLVPVLIDLRAVQAGHIDLATYRHRFVSVVERILQRGRLAPGELTADRANVIVADGDTLCCACSQAAAAAGRCHRTWAAELLRRAGWRVVLDGRELEGVTAEWVPIFVEALS